MNRNEDQQKFVLSDVEMAALGEALWVAAEQMHANANIARLLGDDVTADSAKFRAEMYQGLAIYAPEVIRVAVTVEAPGYAAPLA